MSKLKIVIVGMGYVGMSLAVLLGQKHLVYGIDVNQEKIDLINKGYSPIKDSYIEKYFKDNKVKIKATSDLIEPSLNADYVIIACPTNFDTVKNSFDTSTVEQVIKDVTNINKRANIVIKSTVPVGFTRKIRTEVKNENIFFSPEFLRETMALYDNLHPSRIIVGTDTNNSRLLAIAKQFADMLAELAEECNIRKLIVGFSEAEAIKLFSNAYLALRVAFFNEVDTFAESSGLDTKQVIEGISFDSRIGNYYNNPSFGYGGYCLPKDTMQLLANFKNIPEKIIESIIIANRVRKDYITNRILMKAGYCYDAKGVHCQLKDKKVLIGVYRLVMKNKADNFRNSPVLDIIEAIKAKGIDVIIFEPELPDGVLFLNAEVVNNLIEFKKRCTIIIANRYDQCLDDFYDIVYTRDLFGRD